MLIRDTEAVDRVCGEDPLFLEDDASLRRCRYIGRKARRASLILKLDSGKCNCSLNQFGLYHNSGWLYSPVACDSGQDGVNVTQIEPPTVTDDPSVDASSLRLSKLRLRVFRRPKLRFNCRRRRHRRLPSTTATRSSNDPSDGETLMRLFTKVSREIKNHPRYVDIESNFIECVNSHTDLGIDEFADFYVTYIGENIEVYDRCGDESGIFIIYEDLSASIIEDLRQRDEEIDTLLSTSTGKDTHLARHWNGR